VQIYNIIDSKLMKNLTSLNSYNTVSDDDCWQWLTFLGHAVQSVIYSQFGVCWI